MSVTPQNFCHIEELADGRSILFYLEHDGDDIVLHQVAHGNFGTVDVKFSMPCEQWHEAWPHKVNFAQAAASIAEYVVELQDNRPDPINLAGSGPLPIEPRE